MSSKRSFRDFNYNHSDVFLAVIILIIAAVLILWRIDVIMAYPKTLGTDIAATNMESAETAGDTSTQENAEKTKTSGTVKATWSEKTLSSSLSIKITGKNSDEIIQNLINAGLFVNTDDFKQVCKDAGLSPKDVKSGDYVFAKGMTKKDIAKAVINK